MLPFLYLCCFKLSLCCVSQVLKAQILSVISLLSVLYVSLRCHMYSHLPSVDGAISDLCESISWSQCAPLAASYPLRRPAVGPSGPNASAGMDRFTCPPLYDAYRKGMARSSAWFKATLTKESLILTKYQLQTSAGYRISLNWPYVDLPVQMQDVSFIWFCWECPCLPAGVWRISTEGWNPPQVSHKWYCFLDFGRVTTSIIALDPQILSHNWMQNPVFKFVHSFHDLICMC